MLDTRLVLLEPLRDWLETCRLLLESFPDVGHSTVFVGEFSRCWTLDRFCWTLREVGWTPDRICCTFHKACKNPRGGGGLVSVSC